MKRQAFGNGLNSEAATLVRGRGVAVVDAKRGTRCRESVLRRWFLEGSTIPAPVFLGDVPVMSLMRKAGGGRGAEE